MVKYSGRQKTRFDEERARLILKQLFPERYVDATLSESPDIICEKNNIGVEVTSCMTEAFREKESIISRISGKREEELTQKELKPIKNRDVVVNRFIDGRLIAGFGMWGDPYDIAPVLKQKIQKLNKSYKKFNSNELFVLAWTCDETDLVKMVSTVKTINFEQENGYDRIYICRKHKSNVEILLIQKEEELLFKIDSEIMHCISTKAKESIISE